MGVMPFQQAVLLFQHGRWAEAADLCKGILKQDARFLPALNLLGAAQAATGNTEAAQRSYRKALDLDAKNPDTHYLLGNLHRESGHATRAIAAYRRALQARPRFPEAWINLGLAHFDAGDLPQAVDGYQQALALQPGNPIALYNLGNAQHARADFKAAIASFRACLAATPGNADARYNLANALLAAGDMEAAAECYEGVLAVQPTHIGALVNRAVAQRRAGLLQESTASSARALAQSPENLDALVNLANALLDQGRVAEALAVNDKANALAPSNCEVMANRGLLLLVSKRYAEAETCFEQLCREAPGFPAALGGLVGAKLHGCSWSGLESRIAEVRARVAGNENVIDPFGLLALPSTPLEQLQCARTHAQLNLRIGVQAAMPPPRSPHPRIRIAYLSGDFGLHPVAELSVGLFEHHDRARFETFGVSLHSHPDSALRQRLQHAFEHFFDVADMGDQQITQRLRELDIDIAIDLAGHTQGARPRIMAARAAPVQVSYLGFAGTTAMECMDYILADAVIIEPGEEAAYSERVARVACFMPADDRRKVAEAMPSRTAAGLPETGFVFCAFNASYKITPEFFAMWMRLLHQVPGSVLWLRSTNEVTDGNLRSEAAAAGVDPARLVFAQRLDSMAQHLARHRLADLFLDTLPYNAHTTASDALWTGLPVLTCRGGNFAGRVAASLLLSLGLPELVATSFDEYYRTASQLATQPELLRSLRARLASRRLAPGGPYDTAEHCRQVEVAYTEMWRRCVAGLAPGAFTAT